MPVRPVAGSVAVWGATGSYSGVSGVFSRFRFFQFNQKVAYLFGSFQDIIVGKRLIVGHLAVAGGSWLRPQNVGGQHVEHHGFVDAFAVVLVEQVVAPIEQVIHVFRHNRFLVGTQAQAGDGMRMRKDRGGSAPGNFVRKGLPIFCIPSPWNSR